MFDKDTGKIVHFCGYEERPTENDIKHLYQELRDDPEFVLPKKIEEYGVSMADQDIITHFNTIINENKT